MQDVQKGQEEMERRGQETKKQTVHKSILTKKALGTLGLLQTGRANPVQRYSTHQGKLSDTKIEGGREGVCIYCTRAIRQFRHELAAICKLQKVGFKFRLL